MSKVGHIDFEENHLWQELSLLIHQKRFPQSSLFITSVFDNIEKLKANITASLICSHQQKPCGQCKECVRYKGNTHPDVFEILPDEASRIIKIDQIRLLQESIYKTPKRASVIVVNILNAHALNEASSNALLKILEEPPSRVHFILWAESREKLPLTILSRCQIRNIPYPKNISFKELATYFPSSNVRAQLLMQVETLISLLLKVVRGESSFNVLTDYASKYPLSDFLWVMSLLISNLIKAKISSEKLEMELFIPLSLEMNIMVLYGVLEKINAILKIITQGIHLNSMMSLDAIWVEMFLIKEQSIQGNIYVKSTADSLPI